MRSVEGRDRRRQPGRGESRWVSVSSGGAASRGGTLIGRGETRMTGDASA